MNSFALPWTSDGTLGNGIIWKRDGRSKYGDVVYFVQSPQGYHFAYLDVPYTITYKFDGSVPIDVIKSFLDAILVLRGFKLVEEKFVVIR